MERKSYRPRVDASENERPLAGLHDDHITQELGVMLRACRGFGSTGMEGQIGNLFGGIKKPITIYYIGDHDPRNCPLVR